MKEDDMSALEFWSRLAAREWNAATELKARMELLREQAERARAEADEDEEESRNLRE